MATFLKKPLKLALVQLASGLNPDTCPFLSQLTEPSRGGQGRQPLSCTEQSP